MPSLFSDQSVNFLDYFSIDAAQKWLQPILNEDISSGDLSSLLFDENMQAKAHIISKEENDFILCGLDFVKICADLYDSNLEIKFNCKDGDKIKNTQIIAEIKGKLSSILTIERVILNLLQTLSATSNQAYQYSQLIKNYKTKILDTRKTLPGLRLAQKYATRIGGAINHRFGLYDAMIIKENHIFKFDSLYDLIVNAKKLTQKPIVVEVTNLNQLNDVIKAKPFSVLLDNFSLTQIEKSVRIVGGALPIEVSGVDVLDELATIKTIASLGVDFISLGRVTKDIKAVDLSLLVFD